MEQETKLIVRPYDPEDKRIGPAVADRVLASAIMTFLDALLKSVTDIGWDLPPLFGTVHLLNRTPVEMQQFASGLLLEFKPLSEATYVLARAPQQHHVFLSLAEAYRDTEDAPPFADTMVGLVLVGEAWKAHVPPGDVEGRDALLQAGRERRIHDLPDKIETRCAWAVDINDTVYMTEHHRDRVSPELEFNNADHVAGKLSTGGNIPLSMLYLMQMFQRKTLPDYDSWLTEHGYNNGSFDKEGEPQ